MRFCRDALFLASAFIFCAPWPRIAAAAALDCSAGEKTLEGYDQRRMATVPIDAGGPDAPDELAAKKAKQELLDGLLGSNTCGRDELASRITLYGRGRNQQVACAQAVLANQDWAEFVALHRDPAKGWAAFRQAVAGELGPALAANLQAPEHGRPNAMPRIAVMDYPAQDEVLALVAKQVQSAMGTLVPWVPSWPTDAIPSGVDVVLVPQWQRPAGGQMFTLLNVEVRIRTPAVTPYAVKTMSEAKVSRCLLPDPQPVLVKSPVRLALATGPDGTVCSGDRATPVLISEAQETLHVRVLDLWGNRDGAMLVWPMDGAASDRIAPGQELALASPDTPLVFVSGAVPLERFAVLSARDAAALDSLLGPLAMTVGCRLGPALARKLHGLPSGLPREVSLAMSEVRVWAGGRCGATVDLVARSRAEDALKRLAICR